MSNTNEDKSLIQHLQELWHLAEKQAAMEKKIEAIADRLEDVFTAIVGNPAMGQPGFVKRMETQELELQLMRKEIELLKLQKEKDKSWLRGAVFTAGIAGSAIMYIIQSLIQHFK